MCTNLDAAKLQVMDPTKPTFQGPSRRAPGWIGGLRCHWRSAHSVELRLGAAAGSDQSGRATEDPALYWSLGGWRHGGWRSAHGKGYENPEVNKERNGVTERMIQPSSCYCDHVELLRLKPL